MGIPTASEGTSYGQRLDALRATKLAHTQEKQRIVGAMDHDDHALILPPENRRRTVEAISGSGMPITDVLLDGVEMESNHACGGFFGPSIVGRNFAKLIDAHPPYVDANSGLAGAYMANFRSYVNHGWNPDLSYDHLRPAQERYNLVTGIGAAQHMCQDMAIGLELGWGGLASKIDHYRAINGREKTGFYDGLQAVVEAMQRWIGRTADEAERLAATETVAWQKQNLIEMAAVNRRLVTAAPSTFREACQWTVWYLMAARMFNGSGSLGRLDILLTPFYEGDIATGVLDDEEAVFLIACLLLRDTAYLQLGGPDAAGGDVTNHVSYLVLEAAHQLRVPANVGVAVGENVDPGLLRRGVEIQFEDKLGIPKFLGVEQTAQDYTRNGFPLSLGRQRAYAGCHWSALPGREYTINDCVKINLAKVLQVALDELLESPESASMARLWETYDRHLSCAVDTIAQGLAFHLQHLHEVFPELVIDLLCHGTIEQGEDASHGGVEYTNLCVDGAGLATVADSLAALEQRVEQEGALSWETVRTHLASDWAGPEGERARLMLKSVPPYGFGGVPADEWAVRVARHFSDLVHTYPTEGFKLIPGLFSWANTIPMGRAVSATPNGRHAGAPISHGSNPDPGFRQDGAPSAMAVAIASVQPGYGNTAPMQLDLDPALSQEEGGVEHVADLIRTHFLLGGTQINLNIMNQEQVLAAHEDPSLYPDLVVRVTGFSAYFASLSKPFRQLVVDRIIAQGA